MLLSLDRISLREAKESDIEYIMMLENHKENKDFLWQGTYDQHLEEVNDSNSLLMIVSDNTNNSQIGFVLIRLNFKIQTFELRRIAISQKGKGYGEQTIRLLMKYCFEDLEFNRFWLDVYPDNKAGLALYNKLDMKHEGTLRQSYKNDKGYHDQMIFSLLREEYTKSI